MLILNRKRNLYFDLLFFLTEISPAIGQRYRIQSSFGLVTLLETWSLSYDSHVRKEENIMVLLDNDGVRIFSFTAFVLMISCNRSLVNLILHLTLLISFFCIPGM